MRYKARLVAKGFSQKQNVDYDETFAPAAKIDSVKILLSIVNHQDYDLVYLDVKLTFLYSNITEYLFMKQPEGYDDR